MQARPIPMAATLSVLHQAQFGWMDLLRRAQGDTLGALGLGPQRMSISDRGLGIALASSGVFPSG